MDRGCAASTLFRSRQPWPEFDPFPVSKTSKTFDIRSFDIVPRRRLKRLAGEHPFLQGGAKGWFYAGSTVPVSSSFSAELKDT